MLLKSITLTNFGIYKGEHSINLETTIRKPVILFGAYNGSGKTTILDALQLVLYGKAAQTSNRGKIPYEDYLRSLINRDVNPKTGAGIQLNFSTKRNGQIEEIEVCRSWFQSGLSVKENCEVRRNNIFDAVTSERWHEFVEEFMPSEISQLFFFDGEKIESLADPIKSTAILKNGIYSLLGINAIDNLIKSLSHIEKRKLSEHSSESDRKLLEFDQSKADELSKKREQIEIDKASIKSSIDILQRELQKIESEMKISGADLLAKRHEIQADLMILTEKRKNINTKLHEFAAGKAPLLLITGQLKDLLRLKNINEKFSSKTLPLLINEHNIFIQKINQLNLMEGDKVKIQLIIDERIKEIESELESDEIVDLNLSNIPNSNTLADLQQEIINSINEISIINEKIDSLNKTLLAVPSEEKVRLVLEQYKAKEIELIRDESRWEFLNLESKKTEDEQEKIHKIIRAKLDEISADLTKKHLDDRILNHAKRSKITLESFKANLLNANLTRVSDEITNCFRLLHRKNKFLLKFQIDATEFTLNILKPNNSVIQAKSLSAGERQLLAVSILWALAKCSGKKLPTVIDTPLGRLDGPHREKLVNNYFPKASEQVLIFSTDSEITNDYYHNLKKYISTEYSINYDEDTESSLITRGYFKHMVNP